MKCDKKGLLLYAVTDRSWLNGETLYSQVEKALQGGATFIQLREKNLDQDHFMEEALELKKLCAAYHVPFVINDNVEIAAKMDADGVHVGQSDMEAGDVRAKLGPDKIIGVSAQTVEQAILAEQRGADYLGVGAVFHTGSKADAEDVSHETLTAICNAVKIPVIAIGGITKDNVARLSGSGIAEVGSGPPPGGHTDLGAGWLVGRAVPDGEALGTALELAEGVAENGPLAVRAILRTMRETEGMPEDEAFAVDTRLGMEVFRSADAKEGPRAFAEKRAPEWTGR